MWSFTVPSNLHGDPQGQIHQSLVEKRLQGSWSKWWSIGVERARTASGEGRWRMSQSISPVCPSITLSRDCLHRPLVPQYPLVSWSYPPHTDRYWTLPPLSVRTVFIVLLFHNTHWFHGPTLLIQIDTGLYHHSQSGLSSSSSCSTIPTGFMVLTSSYR